MVFMLGLVFSGLTAFPVITGINFLQSLFVGQSHMLAEWIRFVADGMNESYAKYPFIAYGTDWLGFAHLAIAVFFIDVYRNPLHAEWTVISGLIACVGIIPLALIAGSIREIPFFWQVVDCSFGVFGAVPLLIIYANIKRLKK